jgi:hypothetical protein
MKIVYVIQDVKTNYYATSKYAYYFKQSIKEAYYFDTYEKALKTLKEMDKNENGLYDEIVGTYQMKKYYILDK